MMLKALLCRLPVSNYSFCRQFADSVLFVPGSRASAQVSVLSPYLDFDNRFQNIPELEKNLKARKLNIDVKKLNELWMLLRHLGRNKENLENRRLEITAKIKELIDSGKKADVEKYKLEARIIKDDLKMVVKSTWELEDKCIINALSLPNDLHPSTPQDSHVCVFEHGERNLICSESHIEIGKDFTLIDWRSHDCFYLLNDACKYEMTLLKNVSNVLKRVEFLEISNTDFVRSIVLEGCGISYTNPNTVISINDPDSSQKFNGLHLVGSASLPSFCALHSKQFVPFEVLPLKYFAVGHRYKPVASSAMRSLFCTWQESGVDIFIATANSHEMMSEFKKVMDIVTNWYKQFEYHFRVVYVPSYNLDIHESLRASIQMYSPHSETYIEVGNISVSGTFISKRLLMCYETSNHEYQFLNVLSGTLLSVPKLIGCAIENDYCRDAKLLELEKIKSFHV